MVCWSSCLNLMYFTLGSRERTLLTWFYGIYMFHCPVFGHFWTDLFQTWYGARHQYTLQFDSSLSDLEFRHGIFPPIGGFLLSERSHGSFLRSVQIRWENYRVYWTCERFSESNFANSPHASISFLHGTFSNGVNLFCFGHHHSVHGLAESTTKGSNLIVTCKSAVYGL